MMTSEDVGLEKAEIPLPLRRAACKWESWKWNDCLRMPVERVFDVFSIELVKSCVIVKILWQICSMVLSRDLFVSRRYMGVDGLFELKSLEQFAEGYRIYYSKLNTSERTRIKTRNISMLYEWVLRKSCQYWPEKRILFINVWQPIHNDQIILNSKSKLYWWWEIICWKRNFLAIPLIASSSFMINWCWLVCLSRRLTL